MTALTTEFTLKSALSWPLPEQTMQDVLNFSIVFLYLYTELYNISVQNKCWGTLAPDIEIASPHTHIYILQNNIKMIEEVQRMTKKCPNFPFPKHCRFIFQQQANCWDTQLLIWRFFEKKYGT